jgi:hypothetical protein
MATRESEPSPAATLTSTPPPAPSQVLTPTIVHKTKPNDPKGALSSVTDISTAELADEKNSIGDNFVVNLFERPYTAGDMEYHGYVDIVYSNLIVAPDWIYTVIFLEEDLPDGTEPMYGVEFDLDLDGRGDILISALLPAGPEWTTDGVFVRVDQDGDVGAARPLISDAPVGNQSGFEEIVFLSGQGDDPDLAWVRRDPEESDRIQIAFKTSVLGGDQEFLWGVWADGGKHEPGWFDYNDRFTQEEAGVPVAGSDYYPVNQLALLDSTCRSWFGFDPKGNEPGICYVPQAEGGGNLGWCPIDPTRVVDCSKECYVDCPTNNCIRCQLP